MNSFTKALVSLILSILGVASIAAQPFCRVRRFSVHDGLPSNNISRIIEDDDGLIWTSTWNGLSYYDGYKFSSFRGNDNNGNLTTNRILDISNGGNGLIWMLTYDRNPYLFDSHTGKFTSVSATLEGITGAHYEGTRLYGANGFTWIVGENRSPSVRIPNATVIMSDSVEVFGSDRLQGGASRIRKVSVAPDGGEWIYTNNGIQLYGSDVFESGRFTEPVVIGDVTFFATDDGKFYSYRSGNSRLSRIAVPAELRINKVRKLCSLGDTRLVAATSEGVAVYDLRSKAWSLIAAGGSDGVTDVNVDSRNRIWAFSGTGDVYLTDPFGSTMAKVPFKGNMAEATLSELPVWLEDSFGTVWMAPAGGVFGYYDEANGSIEIRPILTPHTNYTGVPMIEKFYVDGQNNLWLSSNHDLTLVNFLNRSVKSAPLGFNDELRSILPHSDGGIWAGSVTGILARYNSNGEIIGFLGHAPDGAAEKLTFSSTPVKFSDRIYALYEDSDGMVWVGTKGDGLFTIARDGRVSHYRHSVTDRNSLPCDTIYDIVQDYQGNVWVGSYGAGIILAKPDEHGGYRFLHNGNYFSSYPINRFSRVRRITMTPDGVMVLSTTEGLLTFSNKYDKPSKIVFHESRHVPGDTTSLLTSNVMQTLITSAGDVYVATMGGAVQRFVGDDLLQPQLKFAGVSSPNHPLYLLQSTLGAGNVLSMIEDSRRNLYIVRESGLMVYRPSNGSVNVFGPNDLGEDVEFSEASPAYCQQDGKLWFGTLGGMLFLNPDEITVSDHNLNIVFTGVQYQGDTEKQQILNPGCVEVQGSKRNLAITFAALDYADNNFIQYAYRMAEDQEWTYIGAAHSVQFNHLSPGIHRLYVKSTNGEGVWLENERHLDILVHADFWESVWAKILYVVIFLLLGGTLLYFFLQHRKNELTNALLRKEKDFFINASHRLRTPLTLIGSPVTEVLDNELLSDTARYHLERVRRNASEMLGMVNDMLQSSTNGADYITDESVPSILSNNGVAIAREEDAAETREVAPPFQHRPANAEPKKSDVDNRIKILVVEDNDDLRQFLCDILSARYNVIEANNGLVGLEKAEHEQPDFIVTDVTMPEMDGLTMVHNIKQNKALSHIPIIVLSAKASLKDRVQGLREGIDDYITKPFSATYLRQRIANIIAQRKLLQQSIFEQIGHEMKVGMSSDEHIPEVAQPQGAEEQAVAESTSVETAAENRPDDPAKESSAVANAAAGEEKERPEWKLDSPQITDADQEMMEKLLKFMETRIGDEDLKIEELAEAVNMGRTVFYGKIKALVGMPPSDFLRRLRMQRAEELIARSKMNFSQIAFNVGFSDPKYFTKCFKKETGMTPSEYRQQAALQRKEVESESNPSDPVS